VYTTDIGYFHFIPFSETGSFTFTLSIGQLCTVAFYVQDSAHFNIKWNIPQLLGLSTNMSTNENKSC